MSGLNHAVVYGRVIAAARVPDHDDLMELHVDTGRAIVECWVPKTMLRAPWTGRMILICGALTGRYASLHVVANEAKQPKEKA